VRLKSGYQRFCLPSNRYTNLTNFHLTKDTYQLCSTL